MKFDKDEPMLVWCKLIDKSKKGWPETINQRLDLSKINGTVLQTATPAFLAGYIFREVYSEFCVNMKVYNAAQIEDSAKNEELCSKLMDVAKRLANSSHKYLVLNFSVSILDKRLRMSTDFTNDVYRYNWAVSLGLRRGDDKNIALWNEM